MAIALACDALTPSTAVAADLDQLEQMLRVRPGATCLQSDALARSVEPWLYDVALPRDTFVEVEGSNSQHVVSASFLVVRGGQTIAHRTFDPAPPRCEHMHATIGLAIALSLKATLLEDLGRPLPDDPQVREDAWSLTAVAVGAHRVLPEIAPGFELRAELPITGSFSIRLGAFALLASSIDLQMVAGSFDAFLFAGRLDACLRLRLAPWLHAGACGGVLSGPLYARGREGLDRSTVLGWVALTNAASLRAQLGYHWALQLELGLSFPLRELRVGIEDVEGREVEARGLNAVGFLASFGPSYRF